jgi:hypothetical protein
MTCSTAMPNRSSRRSGLVDGQPGPERKVALIGAMVCVSKSLIGSQAKVPSSRSSRAAVPRLGWFDSCFN